MLVALVLGSEEVLWTQAPHWHGPDFHQLDEHCMQYLHILVKMDTIQEEKHRSLSVFQTTLQKTCNLVKINPLNHKCSEKIFYEQNHADESYIYFLLWIQMT